MAAVVPAFDAGLFEDFNLELDLGRAYAASIFDSVPESFFDVKRLFKFHMGDFSHESECLELLDDQLRQLGYIE